MFNWNLSAMVVFIISIGVLWCIGRDLHHRANFPGYLVIRPPIWFSALFGRFGKHRHLSVRGVFAQLLAYLLVPALMAYAMGLISLEIMVSWAGWLGMILGAVIGTIVVVDSMRRK